MARSKAQKAATKRMLAGLARSRSGKKSLTRSNPKNNPRKRNVGRRVSKFFRFGKKSFLRAKQSPAVERMFVLPMNHALAGAGYAAFEAITVPIAARLKNRFNIPVAASQVVMAWGLAQSRMRPLKAIGLEGIGIETYSVVSQTKVAIQLQLGAARLLEKVIPAKVEA